MEALQKTVTLYIHKVLLSYPEKNHVISTCDMSRSFPESYLLLGTEDVTVTIPVSDPLDLLARQVDKLRARKAEITKKAEADIDVIDDKIKQLLCIDGEKADRDEIPF